MAATEVSLEDQRRQRRAAGLKTALGLVYSIVINGVLPIIIYNQLKAHNLSEFVSLVASGVPSMLDAIIGTIRRGRVDLIAGITLTSIAVSIILILLGGSPRLYLVRESLLFGTFGLAYLVSLFFARPLGFYFARQFATGNNSQNVAWFDKLWDYPYFRHTMRVSTIVWGVVFVLEACIRIYLVFTLSVGQFLIVSPFVFYGCFGGLMLWTILYSRHSRKIGERMSQEALAAKQSA